MTISVIIPLYNKVETVCRAIESVLAQTRLPDEIIVINDGSTDGSEMIVEAMGHTLVRLVHQSNAGVSAARNKGLELASSDWIAFLDADDMWEPEYLETISILHASYPFASVMATAYLLEDHLGLRSKISLNHMPFEGESGIITNYFYVAATSHPPLWTSAVVVCKDAIIDVGGFPVGVTAGEDLMTWALLAAKYDIAYCRKSLAVFVLDPAHSYEGKPSRIPAEIDSVGIRLAELLAKYPRTVGLRSYIAHWHKMRASIYLRLSMRLKCMLEVFKSLRYAPNQPKLFAYVLLTMVPTSTAQHIFKQFGAK